MREAGEESPHDDDDSARPVGGGAHGFLDPGRAQPLPHAERHDPVALAGDLPGAAGELRAHLHPDRLAALRLPVHRVAVAAGGGALHRQAADVPPLDRRHGGEPDRPRDPRLRASLLGPARRGDDGRHRLVDLPSRLVAGGAHRLGGALRVRPVLLPGGRQHRQRARAAARGLCGAPVRPAFHRLVLGAGAARDGRALERRDLGQGASPRGAPEGRRARRRPRSSRRARRW